MCCLEERHTLFAVPPGHRAMFVFDENDGAMRNLSIVALETLSGETVGVDGVDAEEERGESDEIATSSPPRSEVIAEAMRGGAMRERSSCAPSSIELALPRYSPRSPLPVPVPIAPPR